MASGYKSMELPGKKSRGMGRGALVEKKLHTVAEFNLRAEEGGKSWGSSCSKSQEITYTPEETDLLLKEVAVRTKK